MYDSLPDKDDKDKTSLSSLAESKCLAALGERVGVFINTMLAYMPAATTEDTEVMSSVVIVFIMVVWWL